MSTKTILTNLSITLITLIAILYLILFAKNIYKQNEFDNYNGQVGEMQARVNSKLSKLQPSLQSFVAVPKYAKKLSSEFKKAAGITKEAYLSLKKIEPPSSYSSQHKSLVGSFRNASLLYEDLTEFSQYILSRDKVLKSLVTEMKSFASHLSKAKKQEEAKDVANEAAKKLNKVLNILKDLKAPIKVYDDKLLTAYIRNLTNDIKDFEIVIESNDLYKIQLAIYEIQLDYADNWQKAFFVSDKKAIEAYDKRVKRLIIK